MRIKIKFKPTANLIADAIRLTNDNLNNKAGTGEYLRFPFIRSFYLNVPEDAMLDVLAARYGITKQKLIRTLICYRYDTFSFETDRDLYISVIESINQKKIAVIEQPFKPKASLLADAIRFGAENLLGKKDKGAYRRLPLLKNIYLNRSEATMLRQLADDAGVGMQPYLRSLICWFYEMAAIDADIDLYEHVISNIRMPKRADSCYAYATDTIYEGFKKAAEPSFGKEIIQAAKTEEFSNDLEDAIDAMCFPEQNGDDFVKIQKTLEVLLTSMKRNKVFERVENASIKIQSITNCLSNVVNTACTGIEELLEQSLKSAEHIEIVVEEADKIAFSAYKEIVRLSQEVEVVKANFKNLRQREKISLVTQPASLFESQVNLSRIMSSAVKSMRRLEDVHDRFGGALTQDQDVYEVCEKRINDICDAVKAVYLNFPAPR